MTAADSSLPSGAVTFLFTDIEGSTQQWEIDPEAMRSAMRAHDRIIRDAVEGHGGHVFKSVGDGIYAVFSDPRAALNAAIQSQVELLRAEWETETPVRVRMGLHTGVAQTHDGDYSGPTLNRVARLMSAGHGGQVLVSSTTHRLVVDELPEGNFLVGLGTHHLKGLDRPEDIYQVAGNGLPEAFDQLRTAEVAGTAPAERAESAYQQKKWPEAADLFARLEDEQRLDAAQHRMYANALWWLGRHDEVITHLEAAYNMHGSEGDREEAALAALMLSEIYHHAISPDVSRAWERRAERLVEGDSGSLAQGHLLRWQTVMALEQGRDLDRALELSRQVMAIARETGDGNLEALSLQDQGRILVATGQVGEGMALMDEAMVAAIAGDVDPMVVGRSYCNMLSVCDQVGDIRRAGEWSEAAERWCSDHEQAPYPGVCRIFKAELLWQKGEWVRAETEVMRASTELGMLIDVVGEAWYQYGDMRLWVGDDQGAESAYQEALARGREPLPGYALLLGRRGEGAAGIDLLERKLADPAVNPLHRARYLPALIELAVDAGDLDKAAEAVADLDEAAKTLRSELFTARAASGRGRVALARGDTGEAIDALRDALTVFTKLGLAFEAARVHVDLGLAYRRDGSAPLADMELRIARTEFERLGASSAAAAVGEAMTAG